MGAYRLLSRAPSAVTWEQVGREQTLTVPNLGCAALVVPGDHVIGRTVPTEEGVMFDLAPVQVPEQVARQVALEPARWVDALGAAADGPDPVVVTPFYDVLPNDVPVVLWQYCLLASASRSLPTPAALPAALASATVRLAREVLVDPSGVAADDALDPWPWLAAAFLEPMVVRALVGGAVASDPAVLLDLSALLAEPAATVCRLIADDGWSAA